MKNGYYKEPQKMEDSLVDFCYTPRTRAELVAFTGMSRVYAMTHLVQPLVDSGRLKLTLPEKPKSSKQRYVKA